MKTKRLAICSVAVRFFFRGKSPAILPCVRTGINGGIFRAFKRQKFADSRERTLAILVLHRAPEPLPVKRRTGPSGLGSPSRTPPIFGSSPSPKPEAKTKDEEPRHVVHPTVFFSPRLILWVQQPRLVASTEHGSFPPTTAIVGLKPTLSNNPPKGSTKEPSSAPPPPISRKRKNWGQGR